jgi:hypothetical protein
MESRLKNAANVEVIGYIIAKLTLLQMTHGSESEIIFLLYLLKHKSYRNMY